MAGTDPQMKSRNCRQRSPVWSPSSTRRPCGRKQTGCGHAPQTPDCGTTRSRAQAVTRRLSYLEGELAGWTGLRRRLDDTRVMFELADQEHDEPTREEATRDLAALRKEIDQLEVRTLLAGEYDAREALITINAQAGGADAADWAEGLRRIYLRWAERHGYPTEIYDTSYAEEAGIKSTTFAIKAPVRVRHAARRARHAPDGAHLQVRQPGPPADLVRRGGRDPGGRAGRPHRHPGRRHPGGRLPVQRAGRPGRQHHRLRGPAHPPAHRDRGVLPERAQPDPEQGHRDGGAPGQAAGAQAGRAGGQDGRAARRLHPAAGAPRSGTTCCTRTRTSRTCAPGWRRATPRR